MNSSNRLVITILIIVINLILLSSCWSTNQNSNSRDLPLNESIKLQQYKVQGEQLYSIHCSNCHQSDGTGLGRLIPPLKENKHFLKDLDRTICVVKNGLQGPLIIEGVEYDGNMPSNYQLTNLEVAEIVTFICNSWGNDEGLVSVDDVETALLKCN